MIPLRRTLYNLLNRNSVGVAILRGEERECDRERGRRRARLEDGSITGRRVWRVKGRRMSMKKTKSRKKKDIKKQRKRGEKREERKRRLKLLADGAIN